MKSIIELYRTELRRIAWRLQYKIRVQNKRELPLYQEIVPGESFTDQVDNQILVEHLINCIPDKGKKILYELFINEKTEAQVAKEMNISQQAVSKWKKKTLLRLYRILSS